MQFTSTIFLIGLLPWFVLLLHFTRNLKNSKRILILLANIIFYSFGGIGALVFICLFSIVIWFLGSIIAAHKNKTVLGASLFIVAVPLLAAKYTGFAIDNINHILGSQMQISDIVIPLGISFFTFEAISLLCDIHAGKINGKIPVLNVYLYLSFFPTVTSGPIIRYGKFEAGLSGSLDAAGFGAAIERVIIGLCKKMLVADKIAPLADYYFGGGRSGRDIFMSGVVDRLCRIYPAIIF